MSGSKSRFSMNQIPDSEEPVVEPAADPSVPKITLLTQTSPAGKGTEPLATEATIIGSSSRLESLAQQFQPQPRKVQTGIRLPEWLANTIDKKVLSMKQAGATKITKEAILVEALKLYLNVDEPK
jgi:hypothetical protein